MKREDKDLLFKDLCARIPYKVIITDGLHTIPFNPKSVQDGANACQLLVDSGNLYPYLRPLSSMTEEECKELGDINATLDNVGEHIPNVPYYIEVAIPEQLDYLYEHHFDVRNLIEKGLALEAPEGMYDIK